MGVLETRGHVPRERVTFMAVSNRQKTSGFACGTTVAQAFEDRITLALALFDDEIQTLVSGLPR